jgi:predicted transcriptional regulator
MSTSITKSADSKGRVTLGDKFANRTVLVRTLSETEVVVELATVVPDRELWLHKNKRAMAAVERGLQDAAAGRFAESPPKLTSGKRAKRAKGK